MLTLVIKNPLGTIPKFEFHHERVTEGFLSHVWWWHESDLTSFCGLSYFTGSLSYQNINMIDLKFWIDHKNDLQNSE